MNAKNTNFALSKIANPNEVKTLREAMRLDGWMVDSLFTRRVDNGMERVLLFRRERGEGAKGYRYLIVMDTPNAQIDVLGDAAYLSKNQALKYLGVLGAIADDNNFSNVTPDSSLLKPVKQLRGGPIIATKLITVNAE